MNKNIKNDLGRQTKNAYHREWQKRNRDKVRKAQERYWSKKAQKIIENQDV